jgi:hypothetical protein
MTDFCEVRGALISKKNKISVITNQSRPKCIQSVKSLHAAAAARCARTEVRQRRARACIEIPGRSPRIFQQLQKLCHLLAALVQRYSDRMHSGVRLDLSDRIPRSNHCIRHIAHCCSCRGPHGMRMSSDTCRDHHHARIQQKRGGSNVDIVSCFQDSK